MAFSYDIATDRGMVRHHLADVREDNAAFSDAEIDRFLGLATARGLSGEGAQHYAAYLGFRGLAAEAARTAYSASSDAGSVDYTARIAALQASADFHLDRTGGDAMPTVDAEWLGHMPMDQGYEEI